MTQWQYTDSERRSYERIEANNPLSYSLDNHIAEGSTVNLSGRGILFFGNQKPTIGQTFDITIASLSPKEPPLTATIQVRRIIEEQSQFKIAGEFLAVK